MTHSIETRIRDSFALQSMMQTFGARLGKITPGAVEITAPLLDGTRQQQGFAHAALTFGIGDSSAGYAALSLMPEGREVLTTEMKINLLAPGAGEHLVARGRVIKPGRRLMVVQSDVYAVQDGNERQIAILLGTMIPVDQS